MNFRHWLRAAAVVLLCCGFLCLPHPGGSPKRHTSLFSFLADGWGDLFQIGLVLAGCGAALLLISYIGSSRD